MIDMASESLLTLAQVAAALPIGRGGKHRVAMDYQRRENAAWYRPFGRHSLWRSVADELGTASTICRATNTDLRCTNTEATFRIFSATGE
jgi:hypothetical protein